MTIVRRVMAAIATKARVDSGFEGYYSRLVRAGQDGVPSAREARMDLDGLRMREMAHRYL